MNWQTIVVRDWLDKVGILSSQREDINKLQELVKSNLLVEGDKISCSDFLKNVAMIEFLKDVEWEELIYVRNAWDDYEYKEDET
jgi:hypothetical protein